MDWEFSDPIVREFAVNKYFVKLTDWDLCNYMLQLAEILRQELYHFSPFSIFLLKRALRNPHMVGHKLFWVLKSQIHLDTVRERFTLILEQYLFNVGEKWRVQLKNENRIVEDLIFVAMDIKVQCLTKGLKEKEKRNKYLGEQLKKLKLPEKFTMPLDAKIELSGIVIQDSRVMVNYFIKKSSKKLPLTIKFKNADPTGEDYLILFKAGDDLRQDDLTLQILRVMDGLWKKNGLDLHINAYGCLSTSDNVGLLQL
jgi:hypothetical protein